MKTYKLKSVVRRGSMLGAAFAVVAASFVPAVSTFADALNPLTDRSLTLSSSAPGWDYLDGSGNATYAPPNSGANGQKVGNTFDFKVSTNSTEDGPGATSAPVKAFTFQYCTNPAGDCTAPGNNNYTDTGGGVFERNANGPTEIAGKRSDLEVKIAGGAGTSQGTMATYVTNASYTTNPDGVVSTIPARDATGNNFIVYFLNDNDTTGTTADDFWAPSTGWSMDVDNVETGNVADGPAGTPKATGTDNWIKLTNSTGQGFKAGTRVKIVFFATDTNYITNPGAGAFFVRMNTYSSDTSLIDANLIDGGVTVANVMNLGIQITTKVLETMDFSVGVVDPYTLQALENEGDDEDQDSQFAVAVGGARTVHNPCEPILTKMNPTDLTANRLQLGDADGEFSLKTDTTYSTHSYWRLSSNSSAGATVYYSGNTLTNTVEDDIDAIGATAVGPIAGSEQFGLALANGTLANNLPINLDFGAGVAVHSVDYNAERDSDDGVYENGADNEANGLLGGSPGIDASVTDDDISNLDINPSWHTPRLYPLVPGEQYDSGAGNVNASYGTVNTKFAFNTNSQTIPVEIASQDDQVVNCVTGKMRYIANIAATTPAGIYTTKINYIAAPQY